MMISYGRLLVCKSVPYCYVDPQRTTDDGEGFGQDMFFAVVRTIQWGGSVQDRSIANRFTFQCMSCLARGR